MKTKQTGRLALAGILTALAVVCLLLTVTPIATVGLAAVAAVCGIPVVVELGRRAGLLHYAAVAALAWFLVPTVEGKGMYIAFFGWYTVFKAWIEDKRLPRLAEWTVKVAVFAAALCAYGAVWVFLLKTPLPAWSWATPLIAVGLCGVFAVYDFGLTQLIGVYFSRIRPKIGDDPDHPRLIKTVRGKGYVLDLL